MYYVHGRWYSPDVGRFISPDEKGEYLYGSGEDAVNYTWLVDTLSDLGSQQFFLFPIARKFRRGAHEIAE